MAGHDFREAWGEMLWRAGNVRRAAARHALAGNRRRKPPEAGLAVPAVPPAGPLPMQGGAAAPLDFDS